MRRGLLALIAMLLSFGVPAMAQTSRDPAVRAACRADVQRLCAGVQPGGGRIGQCVKARRQELSPQCIGALKAARATRQGGRTPTMPQQGPMQQAPMMHQAPVQAPMMPQGPVQAPMMPQ